MPSFGRVGRRRKRRSSCSTSPRGSPTASRSSCRGEESVVHSQLPAEVRPPARCISTAPRSSSSTHCRESGRSPHRRFSITDSSTVLSARSTSWMRSWASGPRGSRRSADSWRRERRSPSARSREELTGSGWGNLPVPPDPLHRSASRTRRCASSLTSSLLHGSPQPPRRFPCSSAEDRPMSVEVAETAIVYPGTVLGDGCRILDHAVVGKQPTLGPRSTAKQEDLPALELGPGTIVSTAAIVFAGTRIGARVIVGDQACVRERCDIGDDVVIGRGALVENDTTMGALTKIQAGAYITAYSTLEDNVFIAPRVITTNDNFMGRTEQRHALRKGPTIRRGARVGAGAVLCPAVEIGADAFVGAGAVVVQDVPPRVVVVGNPARPLREVPDEELL